MVSECYICYTQINLIILECSHSICKPCIKEWFRRNRSCPFCRTPSSLFPDIIANKSLLYNPFSDFIDDSDDSYDSDYGTDFYTPSYSFHNLVFSSNSYGDAHNISDVSNDSSDNFTPNNDNDFNLFIPLQLWFNLSSDLALPFMLLSSYPILSFTSSFSIESSSSDSPPTPTTHTFDLDSHNHNDPQFTFFHAIYRRFTIFSLERWEHVHNNNNLTVIPNQSPFSSQHNSSFQHNFSSQYNFKWASMLGYRLIRNITIEINQVPILYVEYPDYQWQPYLLRSTQTSQSISHATRLAAHRLSLKLCPNFYNHLIVSRDFISFRTNKLAYTDDHVPNDPFERLTYQLLYPS